MEEFVKDWLMGMIIFGGLVGGLLCILWPRAWTRCQRKCDEKNRIAEEKHKADIKAWWEHADNLKPGEQLRLPPEPIGRWYVV